ncbi:MAG TPA: nucleoside triphosphate pyrophosphohydrolase [Gammaproteobacteria bacterium]|nr:nucleoside triphosphate pyrophosphohydrolase [Gammaproteobacteria bacterium]
MSDERAGAGDLDRLLAIMARLRDPDSGCPWDIRQDFRSIAPYTVEEAYEVADAIEREDWDHLCDELGDLLFQVVYHAQMARERGWFGFSEVVAAISDKLVRRHPHVFGEQAVGDAAHQSAAWEAHKEAERQGKAGGAAGLLDDIPQALPALSRATKLQKRAARAGFDWPDAAGVLDKLDEELGELRDALAVDRHEAVAEEVGDLLFSAVNLARRVGVDAESALRESNAKFERRFRYIEARLAGQGRRPGPEVGLAAMDALWDEAKRSEKGVGDK